MFEAQNGRLKRLFKGTRFVAKQISKNLCQLNSLKMESEPVFKSSPINHNLLLDIVDCRKKSTVTERTADIVLAGKKRVVQNVDEISNLIAMWCGEAPIEIKEFKHFYKRHVKFTAKSKSMKRSNSMVKTTAGYYNLTSILNVRTVNFQNLSVGIGFKCVLINDNELQCNVFNVYVDKSSSHVIDLTCILPEKFIVLPDYCILLPNCVEFD